MDCCSGELCNTTTSMLKAVFLEASRWTVWQNCDILWMLVEHRLVLCALLWGTSIDHSFRCQSISVELGFILLPSLLCCCFLDDLAAAKVEQNFICCSVAFWETCFSTFQVLAISGGIMPCIKDQSAMGVGPGLPGLLQWQDMQLLQTQ